MDANGAAITLAIDKDVKTKGTVVLFCKYSWYGRRPENDTLWHLSTYLVDCGLRHILLRQIQDLEWINVLAHRILCAVAPIRLNVDFEQEAAYSGYQNA